MVDFSLCNGEGCEKCDSCFRYQLYKNVRISKLEHELARRKAHESNETRIRDILKKLSVSEMEFLSQSIKEDPIWVLTEFQRMLAIAYDP